MWEYLRIEILSHNDENPSTFFFFQKLLVDLKKEGRAGGYAQISDCYVYIAVYLLLK